MRRPRRLELARGVRRAAAKGMNAWLLVPAALQTTVLLVDEGWFHHKRGLARWERIGHPLNTLSTAACYAWMVMTPPGEPDALATYVGLAVFSSLFIVKDELVHGSLCEPLERVLHALLYVLQPIALFAFGVLWRSGTMAWIIHIQLSLTVAFLVYELLFWSVLWSPVKTSEGRSAITTGDTPGSR